MKRLWKNKACKVKVKQLSGELSTSRTSNRVPYFLSGPGPLQNIGEQAALPLHSLLLLFFWSKPERHMWEARGGRESVSMSEKKSYTIFFSLSRRKQNRKRMA